MHDQSQGSLYHNEKFKITEKIIHVMVIFEKLFIH